MLRKPPPRFSPPLPGYSPSRPSRPSRPVAKRLASWLGSNGSRSFVGWPALRFFLGLLLAAALLWHFAHPALGLLLFKLRNSLVSAGWLGASLAIRKPPLVFVHASQSAAVVWETTRMADSASRRVALRYWPIAFGPHNRTHLPEAAKSRPRAVFVEPSRVPPSGADSARRWIHASLLENLVPATTYAYELVLVEPTLAGHHPEPLQAVKKILAHHQFTWLGIDPPDPAKLRQLSSTSPSAQDPINVLHIAVIGDNQFGVRVFSKIVRKMISKIKSYAPPLKSIYGPRQIIHHFYPLPTKPSLLIHLGDAVQGVHDLKQWQTDFWDPLTSNSKLSSEIPIVYARGNHDFDNTGKSLYTGGLPLVQVGELNRTQNWKLKPNSPLEIPGIAEADQNYTTIKVHPRDPHTRASYHSYSPHPRVRIIVCDSNLEPTREAYPGSRLSEVDEHERWLLWEMARPEWKEASIRIILVHVPPFVEYWDREMWTRGHESHWGQYVRTRFASHFHALSPLTRQYDIPPASLVISGHSHAYSRGLLANFVAESHFFDPVASFSIPRETIRAARAEHKKHAGTPSDPQHDNGVVYVISGGAGGVLDTEKVEEWGFYERSIAGQYHFNYMMLDMSSTLLSIDEWGDDWQDGRNKREGYMKHHDRVYRLTGSQLICQGTNESWESGHYKSSDRLVWTSFNTDGKILDRFIIEADSCR